jgi:uncharacterized membrane protein
MSLPGKLLLFAVLALLVSGAGLWISGGKKGEYSTSLVVDAHPSQVFPYLTDSERIKQWMNELTQIEELIPPQDDEGLPVPTKITSRVMVENGKNVVYQDEVIRFSKDKMISIQSSNDAKVITFIFLIEPHKKLKTKVDYRIKESNIGTGRIFAPLRKSTWQAKIEDDLQRLKELIEENETPLQAVPESPTPESSVAEPDVAPADNGSSTDEKL